MDQAQLTVSAFKPTVETTIWTTTMTTTATTTTMATTATVTVTTMITASSSKATILDLSFHSTGTFSGY